MKNQLIDTRQNGVNMPALQEDLSEEKIRELEDRIPEMAAQATRAAYERAKRAGQTVVVSKAGFIVAEYSDGTERVLSPSQPKHKVKAGVPFQLGVKLS